MSARYVAFSLSQLLRNSIQIMNKSFPFFFQFLSTFFVLFCQTSLYHILLSSCPIVQIWQSAWAFLSILCPTGRDSLFKYSVK